MRHQGKATGSPSKGDVLGLGAHTPFCVGPAPTPTGSSPKPTGYNPKPTGRSPWASAFTLVELIVAMSILVLLVAITVPVASSLIKGAKVKNTLVTLQVLQSAIAEYAHERPMQGDSSKVCEACSTACTPTIFADDDCHKYAGLFGPYPPSPISPFDLEHTVPECVVSDPAVLPANLALTSDKFNLLLKIYLRAARPANPAPPYPDVYASVEALVLFLRTLSPGAEAILKKLPDGRLTNQDGDVVQIPHGQPPVQVELVDLFEVVDAWGHPIRYAVLAILPPPGVVGEPRWEWELRSAGPDEIFSAMFTPEDQSDDVILRGP